MSITGTSNLQSGEVTTPFEISIDSENFSSIPQTYELSSGRFEIPVTLNSTPSQANTYSGSVTLTAVSTYEPIVEYGFTGSSETFIAPFTATYLLEVWGASGAAVSGTFGTTPGGNGGYSKGEYSMTAGQRLYVNVGGSGTGGGTANTVYPGGWNGGANAHETSPTYGSQIASGGGGSDIRLVNTSDYAIAQRIIVAGGGGGAAYYAPAAHRVGNNIGGFGGGVTGGNGQNNSPDHVGTEGYGGSQTEAFQGAGFGFGSNISSWAGSGGGGGWYGGGGGVNASGVVPSGGGGSGYVSPTLTNSFTTAGNASMPNPSGGTMIGNTGNGYARISYLG